LQLARDLRLATAADDGPGLESAPATATPTGSTRQQSSRLSDREREVAELLLLGMPYRDIGSQLFISAKTVEHHVSRMRQRLGASNRSDLLARLRAELG
jgi:DNA-binding CsgD family transcriptional regulator